MDDVASAIADSVRREILEMLRVRPLPARRIAECFPISRPAVSRHLRVLRECGLVRDTAAGRERHYRLDATRLAEISDWLAGFTNSAALNATGDQSAAAAAAGASVVDYPIAGAGAVDAGAVEAGVAGAGAVGAGVAGAGAVGAGAAGLWDRRLDALETEVHRTRRDRRRGGADSERQEKTA